MKRVAENLDESSLIAPRKGEAGHSSELVLPPIHQMRRFNAGFSRADAKTSVTARSSSSLSTTKKYVQVKMIDDNNPQTSASSREALRTGSTTAFSSRRSKSSMVCSPVPFMLSIVMKICLSVGVWRCDSRFTMTRVKVLTRHCRIKASFWIGSKVLRMPCLRRRRCAKKCSFCCSRNPSRTHTAVHDNVPRPAAALSPAGCAARPPQSRRIMIRSKMSPADSDGQGRVPSRAAEETRQPDPVAWWRERRTRHSALGSYPSAATMPWLAPPDPAI